MAFQTWVYRNIWKPILASNQPLALPTPPDADAAAEQMARSAQTMRALARKRAAAGYSRADTILTSAQGVTGPAPTARKSLLGL